MAAAVGATPMANAVAKPATMQGSVKFFMVMVFLSEGGASVRDSVAFTWLVLPRL
jgi:hypothetical protein